MDTVNFCPNCDNMLYIKAKSGELFEKCEKCEYTKPMEVMEEPLEIEHDEHQNTAQIKLKDLINNKFLIHDKTLPQVITFCKKCDEKTLSSYVIYDELNMKMLYICQKCETKH